jgi:hypothetical protein
MLPDDPDDPLVKDSENTEACGKPYPACCGCVALNSPDCQRMQTANSGLT